MKYLETKHERNSAKITSLIVLILLLLLFVVGPPYMDPPLEYGVAVNFGTSDVGSGDIQPTEPIKSEPREVVPQVEETKSEPTTPSKSSENVLTADNAEAIAIKKQKEIADAKAKADADAKAAEQKKKQEEADKKAKLDALIGGVKKSDGKTVGGEGDDKTPGDKGQLDGDPYAPSYFGTGGNGSGGSGGSGYGLNNRGKLANGKVVPKCNEEGRVVVEIHVNRDGKVTKATAGKQGTTNGAKCLYDAAEQTALTYKWTADSKAPANQIGFVKIDFSVTQ
jgi:hypothetical protein